MQEAKGATQQTGSVLVDISFRALKINAIVHFFLQTLWNECTECTNIRTTVKENGVHPS